MSTLTKVIGTICLAAGVAGCKGHEFHPPDKEQQVAQADSAYSPALFDTVQWKNDEERLLVGNEVYARKCDKCHGPTGEGGTAYAQEQGLKVPSLVRTDWEMAKDREAVRHRIYTGHPEGMPIWGIAGITPREIDAVTSYVLEQLRQPASP